MTTALGKVVRTTAFKLSAIYIAVFSISSVVFIVYIAYSTNVLLNEQVRETIGTELLGLSDQYRIGGMSALIDVIDQRAHQPGASLYLMTDADGHILAGNVSHVTGGDLFAKTELDPITVTYRRSAEDTSHRTALVQVVHLPGDFLLLVGRDVGEREQFRHVVTSALAWALAMMIALAAISYLFVSRNVLKRIDSIAAGARRIMLGDLAGRLDVQGSGDEFDRLAESLNAMLDRIEHLIYGIKDVSDNIAHDLKTPLTRLRNRVEAALAGPADAARYRAVLEATIEESDQLIKTFNALLMIARIEAGSSTDGGMSDVDAGAIVQDVAELYEPVADETGVELTVEAPEGLIIHASRELLGQAVANMIDNALKHGRPESGPARIAVSTLRQGSELLVRVADNGHGIPAADRERVVQRFVRLEKSRSQPGSGLGLSLVAAVARLHQGSIELSDASPGLAVTMHLPIQSADAGKTA